MLAMPEIGMPVFARGVSPCAPTRQGPALVGLPVTLGGVLGHAGDVIVGDEDGVVVLPRAALCEIAGRLDSMRRPVQHPRRRPR